MKMKKGLALLLSAALMLTALAACGGKEDDTNGGESEGEGNYIGDTVRTEWFDFTVEEAYFCDEYEGNTPESGKRLVVASMTLKSRFDESVPMFQEDFPIMWGYDEDWDMAYPIDAFTDEQLPDEYNLGIRRTKSGLLVYEVPEDQKDFSIGFMEIFEDDSEGETYFVDFTPDER